MLTKTALEVLKSRYFLKNEAGEIIEDFERLSYRVARAVSEVDRIFNSNKVNKTFDSFYDLIYNLKFLPNTPTLMNAGTKKGQLAACFVLPIEDSLKSIFNTLKYTALIHQSGGGTGFSFSKLRPKGDIVSSTHGVSSGPVSFMKIFDMATSIIKQGGKRRGANMGILRVDHPDILEFIACKDSPEAFKNFNISVGLTKDFLNALRDGRDIHLINPRTKTVEKTISSKEILENIVHYAWKTGDPGIINLDIINATNPTPALGDIEATNPCGEQPLLPYESCTLGSINLTKFIKNNTIDYDSLEKVIFEAVHFLDNVVELNKYPIKAIERMSKRNRKIGLGVMGFADLLILLNIPYESKTALNLAKDLMKFITEKAILKSRELAKKRGAFPEFPKSIYAKRGEPERRNATVTTIAPTGTISIIAGVSSGIEPVFSFALKRNIMDREFEEVHPIYEKFLKEGKKIDKKVFVTAYEISPLWHLKIQEAFQKYTENAVSKTINLPESTSEDEVKEIFLTAIDMGLKGVTVYRDKSRPKQTLNFCNINPEKEC
ncbi:MAG: adenosylcobalamin-dependent ribonucleoside-diphosphate reductase [Proteobacteria bacterium]|nr:adenosylcobalamin-dependent ribonucleoside-diphosphate reductase [Pseudomonadota bacterium]